MNLIWYNSIFLALICLLLKFFVKNLLLKSEIICKLALTTWSMLRQLFKLTSKYLLFLEIKIIFKFNSICFTKICLKNNKSFIFCCNLLIWVNGEILWYNRQKFKFFIYSAIALSFLSQNMSKFQEFNESR